MDPGSHEKAVRQPASLKVSACQGDEVHQRTNALPSSNGKHVSRVCKSSSTRVTNNDWISVFSRQGLENFLMGLPRKNKNVPGRPLLFQ